MRVLIADDSTFMRSALGRAIRSDAALELVGSAKNGREAIELAKQLRPDVVTLDIEMPEMDGLTALRHILRAVPETAVLMCSSLTTAGSEASLQALRLGAADVIAKENGATMPGGQSFHDEYLRRVKALGQTAVDKRGPAPSTTPPARGDKTKSVIGLAHARLVLIGSSTGGPPVLETILAALPADYPAPVVIAQHMPRVFTESMAKRFDELCSLPVIHLSHRDSVVPGKVYICPGHEHSHLLNYAAGQVRVKTSPEPKDQLYYPSVNVLFETGAAIDPKHTVAVVLTGIGEDGRSGAEKLKQAGGTILAQDRASCVVYGMPRAIAEANLADAVLTPEQIAQTLAGVGRRSLAA